MNLSGEAEKLIRHLTVTESNYNTAWKILSNRYDNKRLLISNILERLLNQSNITIGSAKQIKAMLDTTQECIMMLENLELKVFENWDPILLHILLKKLDKDSHAQYEQSLKSPKELQSLKGFLKFMDYRFQSMEAVGVKQINNNQKWEKGSSHIAETNNERCTICNKAHSIYKCEKLLGMKLIEREIEIRKHKLCYNCLKKGHSMNNCRSFGCRVCKRKHNTLLHRYKNINKETNEKQELNLNKEEASNMAGVCEVKSERYVFLGTAVISAFKKNQEAIDCRVLLDSGSQLNFISEKLMRRLGLDTQNDKLNICGIGKSSISSTSRVNIKIASKTANYEINIEVYVIKEITSLQPQRHINIAEWPLQNVVLSDPNFNVPRRIDMLLGAEMYAEFMRNGQIKIGPNLPTLQKTVFGWMVFGKMKLDESLIKFWNIEEVRDSEKLLTKSEQLCEEHFKNTTRRDKSGRFEVSLPILGDSTILGESRRIAFRRFLNIEEKLRKNQQLKMQYTEFRKEYETLGHMEKVSADDIPKNHYFIPHHCVLREESTTTKLRVVFDASCKTTSNLSLNDIMLKGPNIQDDLFDILIRFTTYKYVITADIKKMYRQIKVAEQNQNLQMIMWRNDPKDSINYYKLKTVTYGTRAAPYLAVRCLKQLAKDEMLKYPAAAKIIDDFYVDDIITVIIAKHPILLPGTDFVSKLLMN
ncbi:uncharacterized protein LOC129609829 [Condylostylus longicornis]|uniref:uncharacterized protein LOC129609829 n=1 Tax=Condylostylus longicornis TaxID=2530218 RepID=UPI00244E54FB|nr:uncharacterized protein LOC129609829 [Condylostylus longicornis]